MPANGTYLILLTVGALALLLTLILVVKLHAFLALLLSSMALGLAAGMPPKQVLTSIQTGFGDALGFIAVVVGMGAMIGRFLEYSGGGRALADWLLEKFGSERAAWAVVLASFLVGLPRASARCCSMGCRWRRRPLSRIRWCRRIRRPRRLRNSWAAIWATP